MREEIIAYMDADQINVEDFFRVLDERTQRHCQQVARMTASLVAKVIKSGQFEEEELPDLNLVERAVFYHDIGLSMIPERLLNKVEELTRAEQRVLERHVTYGAKILDKHRRSRVYPPEEEPLWRLAVEAANGHHERWDGKGYPFGLLATGASLLCRATAIADSFDAIVRGSPYRMPLPQDYALLEIVDNSGTQFDPRLIELFREIVRI